MKSKTALCFAAMMLALAIVNQAKAQDPINPIDTTLQLSSENNLPGAPVISKARMNDISSRAIRDFVKWFDNITGEQWYKVGEGYAVYFEKADIKYKVEYDKKGNRLYVMSSYLEKDFIRSERDRLKNIFYDYKTSQVLEIKYAGQLPLYLVRLEKTDDKNIVKTIRMYKDEIKEAKLYRGDWITTDAY